jgi:hypothetical protein
MHYPVRNGRKRGVEKKWRRGVAKDLVAVRNTDAADQGRALRPLQFGQLADVPAELEWLANITNPKTRRAY